MRDHFQITSNRGRNALTVTPATGDTSAAALSFRDGPRLFEATLDVKETAGLALALGRLAGEAALAAADPAHGMDDNADHLAAAWDHHAYERGIVFKWRDLNESMRRVVRAIEHDLAVRATTRALTATRADGEVDAALNAARAQFEDRVADLEEAARRLVENRDQWRRRAEDLEAGMNGDEEAHRAEVARLEARLAEETARADAGVTTTRTLKARLDDSRAARATGRAEAERLGKALAAALDRAARAEATATEAGEAHAAALDRGTTETATVIPVEVLDGGYAPQRAKIHDAGYDLRAAAIILPTPDGQDDARVQIADPADRPIVGNRDLAWIHPGATTLIGTGVRVSIPAGHVGKIYARSGLSSKNGVAPINAVGIIDAGYTGEIIVPLTSHHGRRYAVRPGERVAQLVIERLPNVALVKVPEIHDVTERGAAGFGSTGKN